MSVKYRAGVGVLTGPGLGLGSGSGFTCIFFFKECFFRVRVRVDTITCQDRCRGPDRNRVGAGSGSGCISFFQRMLF